MWIFQTALVAAVAYVSVNAKAACDLGSAPTDQWSIVHDQGIAWLKTPCGTEFLSTGVNVVDGGAPEREAKGQVWYSWRAFFPSLDDWITEARARLHQWGFNSVGGWSLPAQQIQVPSIPDLELGRLSQFHWFDPFDPAMPALMDAKAIDLVASTRSTPYRIGYFSDNEVGWWNGALFVFYGKQSPNNFTKQRWIAHLEQFYGRDWAKFATDFVPPTGVENWASLLESQNVTQLRPGGSGIAAVRAWTGIVAEHYYALVEHALRRAVPHALIFGDRLPIYYDPVALRAEARHVDAIAVNYNLDSGDGWVAPYFFRGIHDLTGGKPVLISEWFFAATENRTGNLNNGHLMTVKTQAERAAGAATAIVNFVALPDLVGLHWFQYFDHPKGGRADGEDYNFGLVDIDNRPYEELTAAITPVLHDAAALHRRASVKTVTDFAIPFAAIDLSEHSLTNWPKAAALLPRLTPSQGEVPFGEAYLAWNDAGLHLATIGQDYYDLDLLAYNGNFPLGEAYQLHLNIDAGQGPRHVTLFMIPPKTKVKDHPPMTALLCATDTEIPSDAAACHAIPGSQTSYFGADQPRITAEMFLPWASLGLSAAPKIVKIDVALSAWHRSRWISLSGLPPDRSRNKPAQWMTVKLAP